MGSAGGIALTVANAIEYNRAKTDCNSVSSNTANVLLWLNIILAVILAIIFIWAIYRLLVHPKTRGEVLKKSTVPGPVVSQRVTQITPLHPDATHIATTTTTSGSAAANTLQRGTQQAMLIDAAASQ
uniref:Transmembrane protein n=1 Tax=Pithovirus LCPAC202 TaxID=2506592 RepID=A0A481Z8X2_9VIRU|nr:MAG: uncharacterized protein LCPAC202_01050 [Pithovirus LCPAC202]